MAPTFEFIASATPSGVYFVDFTNIPQNYDHLVVLASTRSVGTGAYYQTLGFATQWQSEALHNTKRMYYVNNGFGSDTYTNNYQMYPGLVTETDSTAGCFAHNELWIYNYTKPQNKVIATFAASETNGTYGVIMDTLGTYLNNKPLTQLLLFVLSGQNFVSGSRFSIYGVRGAEDSGGTFMDATGGDVIITGGYKYHVFRSSGQLTVAQPGWAEVLVVGGGGGAGVNRAGGGGAGGLVAASTILQSGPYSVVVGAGGATQTNSNGTQSSIGNVIAAGGGFGGYDDFPSGGNGGSGGGGMASGSGSGGSGTGISGQGNNGGAGVVSNSAGGGGGGGAGAAGSAGSASAGGNGGIGSSAFSAWGAATGTGQLSSGLYYFAGGGGGGKNSSGTAGTGGLGGGGNGQVGSGTSSTPGAAGTGGGGGGGGGTTGVVSGSATGTGGSGIVIVRYPVT